MMRSEREMYELILDTAKNDERVRAVILNGSRADPHSPGDIFQDYDVVYVVTEVESFKGDPNWIDCFGERMIMQLPDDMGEPFEVQEISYGYLMQFADGNRIDLTLFPVDKLHDLGEDSLSRLLLDKDGIIQPFPPADDSSYLPEPPTAKAFEDCCNEFWWVSPYVVKGLWRQEILYARFMFDNVVREQLMVMLTWYIGVKTNFSRSPGKFGKHFQDYLEPEMWELLLGTYADADYDHTWEALFNMVELFRMAALTVAAHFGFEYPQGDDERVTAHLHHVRNLPKDAREMY